MAHPTPAGATLRHALAQPANTTTANAAPAAAAGDLRVSIWLDQFAEYSGTAAQLQAEGLIPADFDWPHAAADKHWQAGGYCYSLRRTRPEGHKGAMRTWLQLDNWCLRVRVDGLNCVQINRRHLDRQAKALQAEYHRLTPAGQREFTAEFQRAWAAKKDKRFQAFKALIPGLVPAKPGRKAKVETLSQGADHA